MKITEIRTYLMHAGAPSLKTWAADGSFGAQGFSKNLTGTRNWLFVKVFHRRGDHGHRRMLGLAARDRDGGAGPLSAADRRGSDHIERLWQKMMIAIMGHGMTGTVGAGAINGIDMALWDIKGKKLGVPSGTCSAARCGTASAAIRMRRRPRRRSR